MRVVDEPTAVEARFEIDGAVRPRHFIWTQTWLDVSDVGRSTYSVLLDPRFSSQSRKNKAPQGINVERSQREIRPGPGTDVISQVTHFFSFLKGGLLASPVFQF